MSDKTLKDLAQEMADIDFAMLFTHSETGEMAGRPMSNNSDVEYDGDSYYFTWADSRTVRDIRRDPTVALSMQAGSSLLGKPGLMLAVEGRAELIEDKTLFEAHWNDDLDRWFEDGVDTPGLMLIKVHATRIHHWHGEEEGEIVP